MSKGLEWRIWGRFGEDGEWLDWDCITYGCRENAVARLGHLAGVFPNYEFEIRGPEADTFEPEVRVGEPSYVETARWYGLEMYNKHQVEKVIWGDIGSREGAVSLADKIFEVAPDVKKIRVVERVVLERRQGGSECPGQGLGWQTAKGASYPSAKQAAEELLARDLHFHGKKVEDPVYGGYLASRMTVEPEQISQHMDPELARVVIESMSKISERGHEDEPSEETGLLTKFRKVKGHCLALAGAFGSSISDHKWYVNPEMMSYVRSRYFLDLDVNIEKETDKVTLCGVELRVFDGMVNDDTPF